MPVNRNVVNIDTELLSPQRGEDFGARGAQHLQIEADDIEMPGGITVVKNPQRLDRCQIRERGRIPSGYFRSADDPSRQAPELRQTESTLEVSQPVVVTEIDHFVKPRSLTLAFAMIGGDAVIPEQTKPIGKIPIIGRHNAALAGRDLLDRMKTERGHVRDGTDRPAAIGRAHCMSSVFDENGTASLRKVHQLVEIGWLPAV